MSTTGRPQTNPPLRPKLAPSSTARSPLTPRVAAARSNVSIKSEPAAPRVRHGNNETPPPSRDTLNYMNITPRSAARSSKLESANSTPSHANITPTAAVTSPRNLALAASAQDRNGIIGAHGLGSAPGRPKAPRPKSVISESGGMVKSSSVPSLGISEVKETFRESSLDARFFHASDAIKQDAIQHKPAEPKKAPTFFYADGKREETQVLSPRAPSPVLSAASEQRSTGPLIRPDRSTVQFTPSPMLSPGLSTGSSGSPFFNNAGQLESKPRSPSPGKGNIHLSYRKGASQIFGTRPLPTTRSSHESIQPNDNTDRRSSQETMGIKITHRKSSSMSSIDSGSPQSVRILPAAIETAVLHPPSVRDVRPISAPRLAPVSEFESLGVSLAHPAVLSPLADGALSPTKGPSELAAEARRERKVLDLEISNSSLLAINASLEREVRRQKIELKRFRRLSRAGRLSFASTTIISADGMSTAGDEDDYNSDDSTALRSGLTVNHDDSSDDDDEDEEGYSLRSSTNPTSPSSESRSGSDRLARDEKRLQVDLARHKELLVQSQMMNQSIKRCMYATEDMIREGKKALDYKVRISDVKLGGRVLSGLGDDEFDETHIQDEGMAGDGEAESEIKPDVELDDNAIPGDDMNHALGFAEVWAGLGRPSLEGSDRDSGIDVVDRSANQSSSHTVSHTSALNADGSHHATVAAINGTSVLA